MEQGLFRGIKVGIWRLDEWGGVIAVLKDKYDNLKCNRKQGSLQLFESRYQGQSKRNPNPFLITIVYRYRIDYSHT